MYLVERDKVAYVGYGLLIIIFLGTIELGSAFLPPVIGLFGGPSIFYTVPHITRQRYDHYLAIRDPILGWPSPTKFGATDFDLSGARRSSVFPQPGHECVSLYGDSFTFGDEVDDNDAWGNILARLLGCRVGNFGVGGYGTDQALLRFIGNSKDSAPATVLGVFADNLLRNVNQNRYFLTGGEPLAMKPRYILMHNTLKLVPILKLSFEEFQHALEAPATAWPYEFFLPGARHGPTIWTFPYSVSFIKLLASPYFQDLVAKRLSGQPSWIDFYNQDHVSGALPLTVQIIQEFRRIATERKKVLLVVIFPTRSALEIYLRTGRSPFEPLRAALHQRKIQVYDLVGDMATYLRNRSFCEILTNSNKCTGHFNPEGNKVVANLVYGRLLAEGMLHRKP
jgi:hypothetical protein